MTACPLCRRTTDRPHDRCRAFLDDRLREIPGLYRLLADVMEPGTDTGTRVSGSSTLPLPALVEPLNLRGHGTIITVLATWETSWREERGLRVHFARAAREVTITSERSLDAVVAFLRTHLDWAIDHHPAIHEFAGEVRDIVNACYNALGVRSDLKRIGLCPSADENGRTCGRALYASGYVDWITCDRCGAHWSRDQWLILGLAIAETSRQDHAA